MHKLLFAVAKLTIFLFGISLFIIQPKSWYCENPSGVVDIAYSPDSSSVAVVGANGTFDLWMLNGDYPTNLFQNIEPVEKVQRVVYAPNAKSLLTGSRSEEHTSEL